MDINIIRKDLTISIRQNRVMWSINARRIVLYILLLLFFGLAILLPTVFASTEKQSFLSWHSILGICFLLSAVFALFYHLNARASFFTQLREQCHKWEQNNREISIRLTDENIFYQDDEIKTELKWTIYTSYIIRKNLIILIQQQPFVGDFAIDMSEINKEELQALLNFLQPMPQYNTGLFSG